jgi:hypothetical protein
MKIYIPSRGRSSQILQGPLADMDAELRARCVYVVLSAEEGAYRASLANKGFPEVAVSAADYVSIGQKRHIIGRRAAAAGEAKFLMMDDDVGLLVRKAEDDWPLRRVAAPDIAAMLAAIEGLLDEVASVGVSGREGNNRAGIGGPLALDLVVRHTRVMRVLAYRTEDFLACEHDRLPVMEDFDVQLQLLRAGRGNACLYYWANGQTRTNAPGGCSIWRTREVHEAGARRLAELHPGFVRLRQKRNKTDAEGLGTRTEVTISWKSAFESSQK